MAEQFANICAPASCEEEFDYECNKLSQYCRKQGPQFKSKAAYIDKLREKKEGYFNFTPVMMNGQLATGTITRSLNYPTRLYLTDMCCRHCGVPVVATKRQKETTTDVVNVH